MSIGTSALLLPGSALLLSESAGAEVLAAVTTAVRGGGALHAVLTSLSAAGLDEVPDFAYVVHDRSGTRLVVRGPFTARALTTHGQQEIDGTGVSTWREVLLEDDVEVELLGGGYRVMVPRSGLAPDEGAALASGAAASLASVEQRAAPPSATGPARQPEEPALAGAPVQDGEADFEPAPNDEPTAAPPNPFLHMLGHTEYFGVEAAAVRPDEDVEPVQVRAVAPPATLPAAPPSPVPPPPPAPLLPPLSGLIEAVPFPSGGTAVTKAVHLPSAPPVPLHDNGPADAGHTVSRAELLRMAGEAGAHADPGPSVQAVHCAAGHPNQPVSESCRMCGGRIDDRTVTKVSRPILGRLAFDDGFVHAVQRPVLLGRQPSSDAWTGGEEPQLLQLPDPQQVLSRTHLELRVIDWQLQAVDCGSLNGTVVCLPGREPQQLRSREPFLLSFGTRVVLGGAAAFSWEENPA